MKDAAQTVDHIDVTYVARLARLHLDATEREAFQAQLDQVVAYVQKIRELDVSGVEPTAHAAAVVNVWREDEHRPGLDREWVLRNAPESRDGQIMVPRVVE